MQWSGFNPQGIFLLHKGSCLAQPHAQIFPSRAQLLKCMYFGKILHQGLSPPPPQTCDCSQRFVSTEILFWLTTRVQSSTTITTTMIRGSAQRCRTIYQCVYPETALLTRHQSGTLPCPRIVHIPCHTLTSSCTNQCVYPEQLLLTRHSSGTLPCPLPYPHILMHLPVCVPRTARADQTLVRYASLSTLPNPHATVVES